MYVEIYVEPDEHTKSYKHPDTHTYTSFRLNFPAEFRTQHPDYKAAKKHTYLYR